MPKDPLDDDWRAKLSQLRHEERYETDVEPYIPDPCKCGGNWKLLETATWGSDADGNRGIPERLWECDRCESETTLTYR